MSKNSPAQSHPAQEQRARPTQAASLDGRSQHLSQLAPSGHVTALQGHATVLPADGQEHPLKLGDTLHPGDIVVTSQDGIVEICADADPAARSHAGRQAHAEPHAASAGPVRNLEGAHETDRVIAALNEPDGRAGPSAGLEGGGGGALSEGLRVARVHDDMQAQHFGSYSATDRHFEERHEHHGHSSHDDHDHHDEHEHDHDHVTVPTLGVGNAAAVEGQYAVFAVSLSGATSTDTRVSLTLHSGTATLGADASNTIQVFSGGTWQTITDGTITIAAGQTTASVRVLTLDDPYAEGTETFTLDAVRLSDSAQAQGQGSISDSTTVTSATLSAPVTTSSSAARAMIRSPAARAPTPSAGRWPTRAARGHRPTTRSPTSMQRRRVPAGTCSTCATCCKEKAPRARVAWGTWRPTLISTPRRRRARPSST